MTKIEKENKRERRRYNKREEIANLEELMDYFYFSDSSFLDFIFNRVMN